MDKCRAPLMRKKCTKFHHTLLYRDNDQTERESKIGKSNNETHVSALSVSEQVLYTTCKVKVIAPDGSSTTARALINLVSLPLLIQECLAQHLHLSHGSKSARWKELVKPVHIHEGPYGSKCPASTTMQRKFG